MPNTVKTLVDGRRIVVSDTAEIIAQRIVENRESILVSASLMRASV